jgi:hypothetical protein
MISAIHSATIDGKDVRFFWPQGKTELMPWVAIDELLAALPFTSPTARASGERTFARFRSDADHTKRIGSTQGFTNVVSFTFAKAIVSGAIQIGGLPKSIEDIFVTPFFDAARTIFPDMFRQDDTGLWFADTDVLPLLLGTTKEHIGEFLAQHEGQFELRDRTWMPRVRH